MIRRSRFGFIVLALLGNAALAAAPVSITTTSLPGGEAGVAYSATLSATGGQAPYAWSIGPGALPAGLQISAATGAITGTPTASGTVNFTAEVTDAQKATSTRALSITVSPALTITTTSLPNGMVGTAYSQSLAASGGTGGYTWTVSAGALPNGLTLSTAGAITGTPSTFGTANLTAKVSDSLTAATKALTLTISPATLTVTTTSLPNGTVGTAYSQSVAASGGTGGYTWTISAGSLPQGITLSTAGAIAGTPSAFGTANFTVHVTDSSTTTATKALTLTISPATLTVTTTSLPNGTVGTAYSQSVAASGGTGGYTWTISAGSLPQGLTLSSAGAIAGTPSAFGTANFTIQVSDSSTNTATKALTLTISPATLTVTTVSLPNGTVGTAYSQSVAATGGTGGYTWTISVGALPNGLTLSSAGAITGTPSAFGTANFTVHVSDSSTNTATKALALTISPTALTIATASLPNGTVGTAYSQSVTATGGTGGYTWTVSAGSLPQGLTLSTAGTIAGTPSVLGTANFTIQVSDNSTNTATKALTLTISPATLTITTVSLPSGTVGTAYSQSVTATGGTGGYTWTISAGSLPQGLTLSTVGAITGTPSAFGTANFTVQVADNSTGTATKALTLTIGPAALTITTVSLPNGTVGAPYSQSLTAIDGTGGYTWTISAGSLPNGLTLSTVGAITGTPSAFGTANFTVQVADNSTGTATKALTLTIGPAALTITTASLPNGTVGTGYSQSVTATGGTGGYTWSISAGALPQGLTLSTVGAITGIPSTFGTANFTIQVADNSTGTATKTLTLTIGPAALTITTASLPNGTVGTGYSQSVSATGGTGGYTWTISAGSLPQGLTLSTVGAITGIPSTFGTANFTIQVSDSSTNTATKALTLTIGPGALTITTASLPNGTVGAPYSQSLTASGGTGGYTWTVSAGSLPQGLTLSTPGAITGIPSTFGTASFTIQVADNSTGTATKTLTLTIGPAALTITTASLPNGTVGTGYSQSVTATGGTGGYTWSISAGALPQGLTLSTVGAITGIPSTFGTANFTIQVADSSTTTATKALTLTIGPAALTITTASLPNGTVGTGYSQSVTATGGTGGYTWSISAGALPQGLTLSTVGAITGIPSTFGTASFTIQVADNSTGTATKALTLTIGPAALTITTVSLPNGTVGAPYSQSLTASGGTGGYTWTVSAGSLPQGLTLSTAGAITGTPSTFGTANFTVQAADNSTGTATKALTLTIGPAALTITTASLPNGTVGAPYSQSFTASGGTGGYTWTVSAGSLPQGLTLSTAGAITGTPSTFGTANFTVQAADNSTGTATKALTLTIGPAALTITTVSLPNGTVGAPYSQSFTASGGTGGYTWTVSAGSLPQGLTLSTAGAITGTPSTFGTANFTVQAADNSTGTATKALTLTIGPAALTITTASLPNGTVGAPYSQSFTASGGTGGYTWTVSAGSLPQGLTLSTAGAITGTPSTFGTANFTVQAADNSTGTATKALVLTISPPPLAITTGSLPTGTAGTAYSQTLAASGGTDGYTWTVASGSLPQGLALNTAGAIAGTPSAPGTASVTVQVTDSAGTTATKSLSLTVNPALLVIATTQLPGGKVGTPYSQQLTATGGTGAYRWSISSGSLPPGLSLTLAGAVLGTPAAPGVFAFQIQVADAASGVALRGFSITVISPVVLTTASLPGAIVQTPYSTSLTASGGSGPYIWSVVSGQLPPGLSLDPPTGRIAGIPTIPGLFPFSAQATDALGAQAVGQYGIQVATPLAIVTPSPLSEGSVSAPYTQTVAAAGGSPPYTWTISSGALPPGITLNSGSGVISGTPGQVGTFSITIQVNDSAASAVQAGFILTVASGLAIATAPVLPAATSTIPYTVTLEPAGGSAPYIWAVTAGSLPAGLTFHSSGQIGGTPTAAGTFTFTAQVTDAFNSSASKQFNLAVAPALTITTGALLPNGAAGAAYDVTLAGSGGTPPYLWTVSGGSAPSGFALDAHTGELSGTPAAAGSFTFTVTLADSNAISTQKQFTISIGAGITFTTPAALPNAVAGTSYTFTLGATGGQPPYAWGITNGSLPAGLALNAASGVISGTATANGTFNFTVQVSDSTHLASTQVQTIVVGLPPAPVLAIAGLASDYTPLQQPTIDVTLAAPYPVPVTGRLNLTFASSAVVPADDPSIQFSSGGRSAAFTILANSTHATFDTPQLAVQTGSVAGTITLTVDSLSAAGNSIPTPGSLTQTMQVDAASPVIRSVTVTGTSGGFQVQIVALSNTRELTQAVVGFHPSAGSTLQTSQMTIPLAASALSWFQRPDAAAYGGQFTLTLPFSVAGGSNLFDSVSVILSNTIGDSQETSVPYP